MISIKDIPKYTSWGKYSVDVEWKNLDYTLTEYTTEGDNVLNIIPDFQRGHVWTKEQQIKYVEFCLKGGQSSKDILFNNPSWTRNATTTYNEFTLVDGLQRLNAVTLFINNGLPVFGSNYFSDFSDHPRVTLRGQRFKFHINDLQTKKEVLEWYLELNSGGVVHTQEELDKVKKLLEKEK